MAGTSRRALGHRAESLALEFLRSKGLRLKQRNFHCRFGEIDLVMSDGDELVFVEVRTRAASRFARAAHTVDAEKQRKLALAASVYLATRITDDLPTCRFDIIGIDTDDRTRRIDWRRNAFHCE